MNIILDDRVKKVIKNLPEVEKGRVTGYIDQLGKDGFKMTGQYLKKLSNNLWELRPGDIRVLFGLIDSDAVVVNVFKKKTKKTPIKEIKTAKKRLKEYQI